jgi:predicted amidohydrolase
LKSRALKLALAQMLVLPGEAQRNLQSALKFVRRAADAGADIILLPEALPFGWTDPSPRDHAAPIPFGEECTALSSAARDCRIFICSGLVERSGSQLFNSAVLFDETGKLILHYRKIHELDIAHDLYSLGDRLSVADTSLGRIGVMICADAFISGQVITRTLGSMGAQLILSPCAWAVPPDHDNQRTPYGQLWLENYMPVCRDFGLWIAGCSNVGPIRSGPWFGHRCIGSSLVVGADGAMKLQASFGESAEELLFVDIDLRPVKRTGGRN